MAATPLKPYTKPALTFDQQLAHLEARGLAVSNREGALQALSTISYYRLSGYWHPFRERVHGVLGDTFEAGATFEQALGLYEFDRRLRLLVLDAIERVEVAIRTSVTYQLGHRYGAFGYENAANFHPRFDHATWIVKLHEEIGRSQDAFVEHYRLTYTGFPSLPVWMVTEIMSLGALSRLYGGMDHDDKRAVADPLRLHHKRLLDCLHVLTYIRNVCAHHSRLWNRELAIRADTRGGPEWRAPITPRTDRVFYVLLMLRHLLRIQANGDRWARECEALLVPVAGVQRWRIAMGFPERWQEHLVWTGTAA